MEETNQEVKMVEVDGVLVPLQQFQEMTQNPKIRLKEIEPGKWKTLLRLLG
jgi:hypothetical protein